MRFAESVFKAYDIRGIAGTEITAELAEAVGRAVAEFLPQAGPVIVGRDMRRDSAELAAALTAGLSAGGREVWDIGLVTTDMVYFGAGHFSEAAGGAMVTASHNPGQYNGIKLCGHDAVPLGTANGLEDIKRSVAAGVFKPHSPGKVTQRSITQEWTRQALSFLPPELKPYQVAVDAGNGMAGAIFPEVAKELPFKVSQLFFELDGSFPNHLANPHLHETLADIIHLIKERRLDLGLAFDADGDRGVLIDETGRPVSEAVTGAILAQHFLKLHPGAAVCYDVRTSRIVPDTVEAAGGRPVRTKVGGDTIKAVMRREEAVLGVEASGHYYLKDNHYSDSGLIAVLTVTGIMSQLDQPLSQLAAGFDKYATSDEINFRVVEPAKLVEAVGRKFHDGKTDRLDGLSVSYPDWWFNLRASNTEPLLRLNVEAKTAASLQQRLGELSAFIESRLRG